MKFTFHPAAPIVSETTNAEYADALIEVLEIVAGVKEVSASDVKESMGNPLDLIPENSLVLAATAIGGAALLITDTRSTSSSSI